MSDLDEEELKATKILNLVEKVKECAKNTTREDIIEVVEKLGIEKEKSADEIFEELGFLKVIDNEKEVKYQYKNTIMGDRIEHTIQIAKIGKIIFSYRDDKNHQVMGFSKDELKAINKKCKELGWLE